VCFQILNLGGIALKAKQSLHVGKLAVECGVKKNQTSSFSFILHYCHQRMKLLRCFSLYWKYFVRYL